MIDEIMDYLESEGLGTIGESIFGGYFPPDTNGLCVIEGLGDTPDKYVPTKELNFSVTIKSSNYLTGEGKLTDVRDTLHRLSNISLGGTYFYFILATNNGGHTGRDENGKDVFQINFRARIR